MKIFDTLVSSADVLNISNLKFKTPNLGLGPSAGYINQAVNALAIGNSAGRLNQLGKAIAIGDAAGQVQQGIEAVAIGNSAGDQEQSNYSVAIGRFAGRISQGINSIAIGNLAGETNQSTNSIILNASGVVLNTSSQGLYVKPIRDLSSQNISGNLQYNSTSGEIFLNKQLLHSTVTESSVNDISLTNDSDFIQVITGTSIQNLKLPSPTTLKNGFTILVINTSTQATRIYTHSGPQFTTINSSQKYYIICVNNSKSDTDSSAFLLTQV